MVTSAGVGTLLTSAILVGIGAGANYPELVQIGAVGVGAVLLSMGLVSRRPRVEVRVDIPTHVVLDGETSQLAVTLTNPRRRRHFVTLLRIRVGDIPVTIELGSVGAGARVEFNPSLPPLGRGVYPLSTAALQYRDPFDFARINHPVRVSGTLRVYPRTVVLEPLPAGGPQDLEGRPLGSAVAGGDAFYSLRAYLPGDSWRAIHWPSTARRATLMVRHTTVPEETVHAVVVDTDRRAYDAESRFEKAVAIGASVCQATSRAGHSLLLVASTRSVAQPVAERADDIDPPGPAQDLLTEVRLTDTGVDSGVLRSVPVGACLMVVTGNPHSALIDWLSALVPHLRVGYLVQVLGPSQRPVDAPAGAQVLIVNSLEDFRMSWSR